MAKARAEVTCPTCGRTWTWSVDCYNRRDADEWEARHEGGERECAGCYAETRRRQREEENRAEAEKVARLVKGIGKVLRPLEGTEKQVAWAESIRAKFLREVVLDNPSARPELVDVLNLPGTARWWIDMRGLGGEDLLGAIFLEWEQEAWKIAGEEVGKTEGD